MSWWSLESTWLQLNGGEGRHKDIGKIRQYFTNLQLRKEWNTSTSIEGGMGDGLRKRNGEMMLEDPEQRKTTKSRRLLMVGPEKSSGTDDSGTMCPLFLGAKSGTRREETARHNLGAKKGLDLTLIKIDFQILN